MSKLSKILLSAAVALSLVACVIALRTTGGTVLGSVNTGNEYHSTSTSAGFVNYSVLQSGNGTIGSVVITMTGTGTIDLYDATSTVTNAAWATTTLAHFGASPTVGTYTFDVIFQKGLLVQFGTGTIASTTITYKP